ncbi:ComF family protein [Microbulbifer sp. TRSA001]|uniref:ComF family protein n=1 Tax=unclassified Microbulbifer TaxID=2619833 RepID=UPI0024ACA4EB|nr:phosphoribosyltransferase family protein [Microbulbifer sp. VAAF005]WHI46608.1 phosphoribosyltransferase family protein [Microbulbifer sp. VAAF005]
MQVEYLFDYHPYRGGKNPQHTGTSVQLIKFKQGDPEAIRFFSEHVKARLASIFPAGAVFSVATVPSSTQGKAHKGFTHMFRVLQGAFYIKNSGNLLQRVRSIDPLHKGGSRSPNMHRETLTAVNRITPGDKVVLLDDVTTSGNSLKVAAELLREAGADVVLVLALCKTVNNGYS